MFWYSFIINTHPFTVVERQLSSSWAKYKHPKTLPSIASFILSATMMRHAIPTTSLFRRFLSCHERHKANTNYVKNLERIPICIFSVECSGNTPQKRTNSIWQYVCQGIPGKKFWSQQYHHHRCHIRCNIPFHMMNNVAHDSTFPHILLQLHITFIQSLWSLHTLVQQCLYDIII